ncbi:CAMK family protein kinase [Histomonas meleagridis]|uniref:CAMK family protein kinase n=1 Tax=Histomonas meleagridis TaxID=135588 RepID=UPI00355ABB68|nr:CAMK family protein kinase [Histomonas meleagridis]KAH0799207.1 CAMK family protein kinase [Histomonas meleagridis]
MSSDYFAKIPECVGDFQFIEPIDYGSSAAIWKARHNVTKDLVAIKCISKAKIKKENLQKRLICEISVLQKISHPLISQFFQYLQDENFHYIVIEYAPNGDLLKFVNTRGRVIEPIARKFFTQIITVLEYLHKEVKVIHRDLKPENILLDQYFNIRVIDFGLCHTFQEEDEYFKTMCGTPAYVAPEMITGQSYTIAAEIWSAGILLYALVVGNLPFKNEDLQTLLNNIAYSPIVFPTDLSPSLTDLIKKMLIKQPEARITIDKIKEHPWFSLSEYQNLSHFVKRWENYNGSFDGFDQSISNELSALGLDTSNLKQMLFSRENNDSTVVAYLIKKKMKTSEEFNNMLAKGLSELQFKKIVTRTPQPQATYVKLESNRKFLPVGNCRRIVKNECPIKSQRNIQPMRPAAVLPLMNRPSFISAAVGQRGNGL